MLRGPEVPSTRPEYTDLKERFLVPKIGLLLNNFMPTRMAQEAAKLAEERGYDVCWMTETSTGYGMDTPSQLAAIALATSRIRLGPAILPVFTRTPTLMAQVATSLDDISNGRFVLGLGTGHGPSLARNHGLTLKQPFLRMREYVHILREALSEAELSFHGEIYDIPNLRLPLPNPQRSIPIYLAALGPRMAQFAGEVADGVIFNMAPPEYLRKVVPKVKEAAARAGRDPDKVEVICLITASADGPEGEQMCRTRISNYLSLPFYQNHLRQLGFTDDVEKITSEAERGGLDTGAQQVSDRLLHTLTLAGDPEKWPNRIKDYHDAGADIVCPHLFTASDTTHGPPTYGPAVRESILNGINALSG